VLAATDQSTSFDFVERWSDLLVPTAKMVHQPLRDNVLDRSALPVPLAVQTDAAEKASLVGIHRTAPLERIATISGVADRHAKALIGGRPFRIAS
jgi:hypothetical protein